MNAFSIIGIFVFLSFVYGAPPRGPIIFALDVAFENGEKYTAAAYPGSVESPLMLMGLPDGSYQIVEFAHGNDRPLASSETFDMNGVDTMFGNVVVVRTNNSYFQMETVTEWGVHGLFDITTRHKLVARVPFYSYSVSAVHKYHQGRVLEDVSISGYTYETAGNPQERYIIHSGRPTGLVPHILWTEGNYNYSPCGPKSMLLTLVIRPSNSYEYFLVEFFSAPDFENWVRIAGQRYSRNVPLPPSEINEYVPPPDLA